MTDTAAPQAPPADGRPGFGAQFAAGIDAERAKRARSSDIAPLVRLMPYLVRRRGDLALAGLFLVLAAAATLALPAAARQLVDGGFATAEASAVNRGFALLVLVAVFMAVFSASRFYFVTKLGERVVADLKTDFHAHLTRLSPAFYARVRVGEALSRLTVDATLIDTVVSSSASIAIRNILMLTGGLAMMLKARKLLNHLSLIKTALEFRMFQLFKTMHGIFVGLLVQKLLALKVYKEFLLC